jgi:RimJ/RimL family protein N-acetyltransferase
MSNRPIGPIVDPLPSGAAPDLRPLHGRWMRLDPLSLAHHGVALWNSFAGQDPGGDIWTYMPYGPFADEAGFLDWLKAREAARDPWFYTFVKRDTGEALGMGAFMRFDAPNGAIEIGNIWMAPALQRTREATEAIYLMMRHCFDDLGVRRLEWKCDALNAPSRKAAARFGFEFEGLFRQHYIIKGRNRDTAWFAMIDKDWPRARAGFEAWLDEGNFDEAGRQKNFLSTSFQTRT